MFEIFLELDDHSLSAFLELLDKLNDLEDKLVRCVWYDTIFKGT